MVSGDQVISPTPKQRRKNQGVTVTDLNVMSNARGSQSPYIFQVKTRPTSSLDKQRDKVILRLRGSRG
jgi:hypothetical protein